MNKESKGRVDYYDSLRVAAMVAVVMIHVATPVIKMGYKIGGMSADWWTGDVYTAMTRFAVLVFLMISGAAMLGQRYGYRDFARRRMVRIFVPFACFTVLYLAFKLKMDRPAVHVGSLSELWRWIGDKYIECGVSQHFWYVYLMAVLYPLIPLTQRLLTHWETEEERKRGLRRLDVVIAAWVLFLGLWYSPPLSPWRIPDAVPLTRETMWSVDGGLFFVRKLVSYLTLYGYMLLGYRLRLWTENMDGRRMRMWKWVAAVVYVATTAVCALGTAWLTHRNGRLDVAMQGYMQVNTVLQSWAVFMLLAGTDLRRWSERRGMGWIADVRDSLSRCSYGIYLIHIMVISTLWSFRIYWGIGNPIWSVPLLTAAVTAVSWAVVWLIGRWRWGRYVVG